MSEDLQRLVDEQARVMGVQSMPVKTENKGSAATDRVNIFVNPSFASSVMSSAGSNGMRFVLAHELAHARAGCPGGHSGEPAIGVCVTTASNDSASPTSVSVPVRR